MGFTAHPPCSFRIFWGFRQFKKREVRIAILLKNQVCVLWNSSLRLVESSLRLVESSLSLVEFKFASKESSLRFMESSLRFMESSLRFVNSSFLSKESSFCKRLWAPSYTVLYVPVEERAIWLWCCKNLLKRSGCRVHIKYWKVTS